MFSHTQNQRRNLNLNESEENTIMSIESNLNQIKTSIPETVKLVAVSKFHPEASLLEAYNAGQRVFGENKVQELDGKQKKLPQDIEWHFIGHLQTNKVKNIASYIDMIESIDSWKLLCEVDKYAKKENRTIKCLLEIHIAKEDSKYGFSFDSCRNLLEEQDWRELKNIQISGVMGMATNTDNDETIKEEFRSLKLFFDELKHSYFEEDPLFAEISMGMSHDYPIAIEEGATIVRVGSAIFGQRQY